MSFKFRALMTIVTVMAFVACAKNSENHAPVCAYGQTLAYTNSGYACDFVTLTPPGYNTAAAAQANQMPVPGGTLSPPVQSCGGDPTQTLINWMGTWICYFTTELYPSNGNSPQTLTPPAGQGGEFCTSAGLSGYALPYAGVPGMVNPLATMSSMTVQCSPGFVCQQGTTTTAAAAAIGMGSAYGQAGTCVYSGYHGSY